MSSFEDRVQKILCEENNHENKPIIMICFNKDCQKRKVCLTCIDEFHSQHKNELATVEDVEQFITKNCIKQKGSSQCNQIILSFNDFQNQIISDLKIIEFILKEKVKMLFNKLNNEENKLQQIGDDNEEELNQFRDNYLKNLSLITQEWKKSFDTLKQQISPISITINKFERTPDRENETELEISAKQSHITVLYPKKSIQLQSINLTELLNKTINEQNQQESTYQIQLGLYKNFDLTQAIYQQNIEINHKQLTNNNGYYTININKEVYLQQGETYCIEISSGQTMQFKLQKELALDNELIVNQNQDYDQKQFNQKEEKSIICKKSSGIIVSYQIYYQ